MTHLADRIAALSPEKRRLLDLRRKERPSAERPRSEPFSLLSEEDRRKLPPGIEDAFPLSHLQLGMLYHMEVDSEGPGITYHNVYSWHLRAPFNAALMEHALRLEVPRHPFLRTGFDLTTFSEPLQLVHSYVHFPITFGDLRSLSSDDQEAAVTSLTDAESQRPFDVTCPPLWRFHMHRRSEQSFQFTLTEFHPICDGWSLNKTLSEIFSRYLGLLDNEEVAIGPPPIYSYRDFVILERQALESEECRRYWDQVVEGATVIELPHWKSKVRQSRGARNRKIHIPLPVPVQELERRIAIPAGVSIKSVLLAAHMRVLGLFAPGYDVMTGLVGDGRPEEIDGDQARGLFVNTLPYRLRLIGGTWLDLARQVFDAEVEMLPFRRYPLAVLQKRAGRQHFFETTFLYVHFHSLSQLFQSGKLAREEGGYTTLSLTNYPLAAVFQRDPGSSEITLTLVFDDTRLERTQVELIAYYYQAVLKAMATDPHSRYDNAMLLSEEERHQLLVEWNATAVPKNTGRCLYRLFKEQVQSRPEAVAVSSEDGALTYRELDLRSNQLARHLRGLGVGPEVLVGIYLAREVRMMVALWAVLKAGGAYVPLDPSYPRERLAFMLEDAGLSMLISEEGLADAVTGTTTTLVLLDRDWQAIAAEHDGPCEVSPPPEEIAYAIYTSGSTGQPKAVMVSRGALLNLLDSMLDLPSFQARGVMLGLASLAFDMSVPELYLPLLTGGRLDLVTREQAMDGAWLFDAIKARGTTVLQATPTSWRLLIEAGWQGNPRLSILCGAEAFPGELATELCKCGTDVWNLYGPTETTVWSLAHRVWETAEAVIPIGRPIAHTAVYVLDARLFPLSVGAVGELWIGGAGVARGYLGRPELTAERFVPDPYGGEAGARMYRTGDLARFRPDGVLEFLGRIDHQVKIRGFRVELGEIEALLLRAPGVRQAVAVAREDTPGDRRLAAYVVADRETASTSSLRALLKESLPHYMVPSSLIVLDSLPLSPNGKVDRRALPAPGQDEVAENSTAPPRNPTEEVLAGIWAGLLRTGGVGIHDDFFSVGGDSLLATRLISQVRKVFGVELPLRVLFEGPTVAALAGAVQRSMAADRGAAPPPLTPAPRTEDPPLSFAQERLWFLDVLHPGRATYNIPLGARLTGALDVAVLRHCLGEILRRHESLRTTFEARDGRPVQVVAGITAPELPVVDLGGLPGVLRETELRRLGDAAAWRPFDLTRGPLLRAHLFRLADRENVLLLILHHIIGDAWSTGVLAREVSALYGAFLAGRPSPLPPLPVQYADFALWQRRWLQGETLENELSYWRRQLGGTLPALSLPAPRRTGAGEASDRGAHLRFEIPPEPTARLKAFNARERVTLFMTLLAALTVLLHRELGSTDVVVGTDIANRNRVETEGLIGFFINLLALRVDLSGTPSFRELLQRVRRVTLEAYAHQDVPFAKVVEALGGERKSSHSPVFEVLFVLQNNPRPELDLPGLAVSPFAVDEQRSRFDLGLFVHEENGVLQGRWTYRVERFEASAISRLQVDFERLLDVFSKDPDLRLDEVGIDLSERGSSVLDSQASFDKFPRTKPKPMTVA